MNTFLCSHCMDLCAEEYEVYLCCDCKFMYCSKECYLADKMHSFYCPTLQIIAKLISQSFGVHVEIHQNNLMIFNHSKDEHEMLVSLCIPINIPWNIMKRCVARFIEVDECGVCLEKRPEIIPCSECFNSVCPSCHIKLRSKETSAMVYLPRFGVEKRCQLCTFECPYCRGISSIICDPSEDLQRMSTSVSAPVISRKF